MNRKELIKETVEHTKQAQTLGADQNMSLVVKILECVMKGTIGELPRIIVNDLSDEIEAYYGKNSNTFKWFENSLKLILKWDITNRHAMVLTIEWTEKQADDMDLLTVEADFMPILISISKDKMDVEIKSIQEFLTVFEYFGHLDFYYFDKTVPPVHRAKLIEED